MIMFYKEISVIRTIGAERMEKIIQLDKGKAEGFLIELDNAPLILIKAKKGYVMCGYLNMNAANKLGDIAGRVTKVKSFEDVLNAEILEISDNAKKAGLAAGMRGKDFLNKLV
jgi:uncharacterized protein YunC (DUF1805 family)